jgi:hypothetical protein
MKVRFKFAKDTKNTRRFDEVDADGNFAEMRDAVVGGIYVKAKSLEKEFGSLPETIELEVSSPEA